MDKKILIIDDDPLIRLAIEQDLKIKGYTAKSTEDGPRGLQETKTWKPDIIILDHHMPAMTGVDFLRLLRKDPEIAGIKVIYLTSDNEVSLINDAISLGVSVYLNKSEVKIDDITEATIRELK